MFGNFFFSVAAFILALGILISIHEFGHFWVARKVGVKVLKFSIGFGKAIWSRKGKVDDTEYVIAAIPLGGYVKMLDEAEGNVDSAELDRAFNRKNVWQRIAVVIAGPMANFILAIIVYWIVMMTGISGVSPLIGDVTPGSSAEQAGFEFEDKIISIENTETPTWSDARIALLKHALDGSKPDQHQIAFNVETAAGTSQVRQLSVDGRSILKGEADIVGSLGFEQWWPRVPPVIGGLQEDGAATIAGMLIGDQIMTSSGDPVETWRDWVMLVRANPGKTLDLEVMRGDEVKQIALIPGTRDGQGGNPIGFIGAWETTSFEQAQKARVTVSYPPLESLVRGLQRTWEMSILTLKMNWRGFTGKYQRAHQYCSVCWSVRQHWSGSLSEFYCINQYQSCSSESFTHTDA